MIAGDNPHYVHSLVQALASNGLRVELIGSDSNEKFEYSPFVKFMNLRGSQERNVSVVQKLFRIVRYYYRCLSYIWKNDIKIVHIQAFRFKLFEGIVLVSLYKLLGKKAVYTAHNVQPKGKNNILNYITYYFIYRNIDHIICHTRHMKEALMTRYRISEGQVSIVPHGLNFSIPITQLSRIDARNRLGLDLKARILLIFGKVEAYKGIDIALQALKILQSSTEKFVLLIIGGGSNNNPTYLQQLKDYVHKENLSSMVRFDTNFIQDKDIEIFFKSADVLLLPYKEVDFQSGVLFLSYRFGLPVIASNLGSFSEEIEDRVYGYTFCPCSPTELAAKIRQFYQELFLYPGLCENLRRRALEKYSWDSLSRTTMEVYQRVL